MKQVLRSVPVAALFAAVSWGVDCRSELGQMAQFLTNSKIAHKTPAAREARFAQYLRQFALDVQPQTKAPTGFGTTIAWSTGTWNSAMTTDTRNAVSARLQRVFHETPGQPEATLVFDTRLYSQLFLELFQRTPNQLAALYTLSTVNPDQVPRTLAAGVESDLLRRIGTCVGSAVVSTFCVVGPVLGLLYKKMNGGQAMGDGELMAMTLSLMALTGSAGFTLGGNSDQTQARKGLVESLPPAEGETLYSRLTPSAREAYDEMRLLKPGVRYLGFRGSTHFLDVFQWGSWIYAYVSND